VPALSCPDTAFATVIIIVIIVVNSSYVFTCYPVVQVYLEASERDTRDGQGGHLLPRARIGAGIQTKPLI
jgi:hypothetical protein